MDATLNTPKSGYEKVLGMAYFPRMLDKMRLHAKGLLRDDFHANLGRGADNWCAGFLQVDYGEIKERVLQGGTDEEILLWCFEKGRKLNDTDLLVWNHFATKLGWRDMATPRLEKYKAESGLGHRSDLVTMVDYFDVDEGRKP
jgi:gluconokinase